MKTHLHKTLTDLIRERIIKQAGWELPHTVKPVKEIAIELGFDDIFYLSRLFEEHAQNGVPGINGAVVQRQNAQQPWMNYVYVASIDAAIEKAAKLGATVALPKTIVPGAGAVAAIVDPRGNICGLWEEGSQ